MPAGIRLPTAGGVPTRVAADPSGPSSRPSSSPPSGPPSHPPSSSASAVAGRVSEAKVGAFGTLPDESGMKSQLDPEANSGANGRANTGGRRK